MNLKPIASTIIIAAVFFGSIWTIADEMQYLSLMQGSGRLILMLFIPTVFITYFAYTYIKRTFGGLDLFRYTGISFVFILTVCQAMGLYINRSTATNCVQERAIIQDYKSMFVSGNGRMKSEKAANRWELTLSLPTGQLETYTLKEDISKNGYSSSTVLIESCTSVFGTKMFSKLIDIQ